ncbi:MAG: hypothetical protein OK456_02010 [Thaumarchaeota archaeon]|nr:hypothetical protein [Nitrososphaerota archaeon]
MVESSAITRTIRLDKELDDVLQKIARDEKVTVNSIVNRCLRQFVDWDRHADKFGMATIRPALLTELISRLSVDEARQLGRDSVKDSLRPAIEYIFVEFSLPNFIEFMRRFARYSGRFEFEDSVDGRKHVILVRHSTGLKWSAYYEGMVRGIFEDELGIKIKASAGPESFTGTFEV